jgi:hypothetical protein
MHADILQLRNSASLASLGDGITYKSWGGGGLPNRSGLSSAGSMTGGLGISRQNVNSTGQNAANSLLVTSTTGSFNSQGLDLYYKRRAGSANPRNGKVGAFNRGNKPPQNLAVIQTTHNALLASLGTDRDTAIGSSIAAMGVAGVNSSTEIPTHARSSASAGAPASAFTSSAAAAAAAAEAIVMQNKGKSPLMLLPVEVLATQSARGKKNVRWSDSLTKCSPEHTGDPGTHQYTSILSVGGKVNSIAGSNTGANTGVGGLGVGSAAVTDAKAKSIQVSSESKNVARDLGSRNQNVEVIREKAAIVIEAGVVGATATSAPVVVPATSVSPKLPAPTMQDSAASFLHSTSPQLISAINHKPDRGDAKTAPEARSQTTDKDVSESQTSQPAHRHRPVLEMRRNVAAAAAASASASASGAGKGDKSLSSRPSLSEQLAAISASAGALTASIRASAGMDSPSDASDPPIVVLPAKAFSVGTLNCRFPSPARFYRNRIEYTFHHPFEASEIMMIMHYADMTSSQLAAGKLKFKLPRRMTHFPDDFNPNNPSHAITIELGTTAAFNIVREKVMPLMTGSHSIGMPRR